MSRCKNSTKLSTPDPDLARWCAALATNQVTQEVPEGWETIEQLAKQLGKSRSTMARLIDEAFRAGRVEMKKFTIYRNAKRYPTPHYRLT